MYLTYRKTLAVGGTIAAIVGLGGTALAVSGPDTVLGTPAASSTAAPSAKHHGKAGPLKRLEHGQFVTGGKKRTVTHTIWRGSVTAVSPTSITVKAKDSKSQSYTITKDTKVKHRTKGSKPTPATIGTIAKGDQVMVAGVGTPTVTARTIVEFTK